MNACPGQGVIEHHLAQGLVDMSMSVPMEMGCCCCPCCSMYGWSRRLQNRFALQLIRDMNLDNSRFLLANGPKRNGILTMEESGLIRPPGAENMLFQN